MTLLTTLFEHREAEFAADGTILVGAQGTPNLIPNPCAATTIDGWTEYNPAAERVDSIAGVVIPSGTAIHSPAESGGTVVESDPVTLGGLQPGDFLYVQTDAYVGAIAAGEVKLRLDIGFIDELDNWQYEVGVYNEVALAYPRFERVTVVVEIPEPDYGALKYFTVYATIDAVVAGAANDAELYITQVQVLQGEDGGTVPRYGASSAALSIANDMAASGTIALGGSAWLSSRTHGQDTLAASGFITIANAGTLSTTGLVIAPPSAAILSSDDDPALPATVGGWTAPSVTAPDIQGLSVALSGLPILTAQISDLTIELDVEGGPKSATMSLNCPLDRRPKVGATTLVVTYKTQTLFRGRLEMIVGDVSSSTGYSLTFAGPLVTLRDHKAYRAVYVDSDLDSWRVDQGPQTSPDTFEGIAAGVW